MAKDYKHRAQQNSRYHAGKPVQKSSAPVWRWLLVIILIAAFIISLNKIRELVPELLAGKPSSNSAPVVAPLQTPPPTPTAEAAKKTPPPTQPEEPRYDFYTLLPQAEVVVPDYEIKSRVREELVGKTKSVKYVMQAGAFQNAAEADKLKAKLAQLGIESRVEKAKVGNIVLHRVKIGPYDNPSSVSKIKELLQKNGIGVIVTEAGN